MAYYSKGIFIGHDVAMIYIYELYVFHRFWTSYDFVNKDYQI
jgi:hypothetical protein